MVSLCGGVLVPEYLERWFNISIWLPACNNVTLIDWIYFELLTQLKTMCAVQPNRSRNQRLVASPRFLWENVLSQRLVCQMGVCRRRFPFLSASHWLKGWDDLCRCSLQLKLISSWYGPEEEKKKTTSGVFFFKFYSMYMSINTCCVSFEWINCWKYCSHCADILLFC